MKKNLLLLLISILIFYACGNSPKSNSQEEYISGGYSPTVVNDDGRNDGGGGNPIISHDDTPDIGSIRLTGRIETCNKCRGYGMVQEGLSGQPEICKFCWISTNMLMQQGWTGFDGRYGQVDAVFNTLPANYFDKLDWNSGGGYDDNGGGNGTEQQIEAEIARHEENIALIEHQLEYIEGSVNRTYLEQQLIEERYEVKRLKNLLNRLKNGYFLRCSFINNKKG